MKKHISLDEQLQLIAKKSMNICVGNPTYSNSEFNFTEKKLKFPVRDHNIDTANPIA